MMMSSPQFRIAALRLAGGLLALQGRGWNQYSLPVAARATSLLRTFAAANDASDADAADADANVAALAAAVSSGDRSALSRAITLCESTRPEHSRQAAALLRNLIARGRGGQQQQHSIRRPGPPPPPPTPPPMMMRIAVSGPPGAGKSSLIEALGCHLADAGGRVAVLAVDPSSPSSGGAVLGDRTRMPRLSAHPRAFVRASAARGALGGVARATADACALCEAAGYATVLCETVGVGQSEVDAAYVADAVVLVLPPDGAGDELQAMKRGLMEVADVVAVNKADDDDGGGGGDGGGSGGGGSGSGGGGGGGERAARRTVATLTAALAAAPPGAWGVARWRGWRPRVLAVSAKTGRGVDALALALRKFGECVGGGWQGGAAGGKEAAAAAAGGSELAARRAAGRERLAWLAVEEACVEALRADERVKAAMAAVMPDVRRGELPARAAAEAALRAFRLPGDARAKTRG